MGSGEQLIPRPAGARPGAAAPWAKAGADARQGVTMERVRSALLLEDPTTPETVARLEADPKGEAGVLVPLFEEAGETRVILTRRAAHLRSHTGQVAFPGGRLEPGEGALAGALREAHEEIGLDPGEVEVLGQLAPLATVSTGSRITPFVGAVARRPRLSPNPAEVARIFDVSLADLVNDEVYREERWDLPGQDDRPMHFFEIDGETVWGATARILTELLELVVGGA
ncbi:MAG TPA: CoA pyrophosphatase [Acidimicrobiales bacterium]|nr:CoA pyrophosphatase [Acidimicrobiales bacterium]